MESFEGASTGPRRKGQGVVAALSGRLIGRPDPACQRPMSTNRRTTGKSPFAAKTSMFSTARLQPRVSVTTRRRRIGARGVKNFWPRRQRVWRQAIVVDGAGRRRPAVRREQLARRPLALPGRLSVNRERKTGELRHAIDGTAPPPHFPGNAAAIWVAFAPGRATAPARGQPGLFSAGLWSAIPGE